MKRPILWAGIALLAVGASFRVLAMAGELQKPSLAFPAEIRPETRERLLTIISDPACKFLRGTFINANTTLDYGGPTEALNHLLERLAACDGICVHVTFTGGTDAAFTGTADASWTLRHSGWGAPNRIEVQVNPASGHIQLARLEIPEFGKGTQSGNPPNPNPPPKPNSR